MRRLVLFGVAGSWFLLACDRGASVDEAVSAPSSRIPAGAAMPSAASASALLSSLRARFDVPPSADANPDAEAVPSALLPSASAEYRRGAEGLEPLFATEVPSAIQLLLPEEADGWSRLRDEGSLLELGFRVRDLVAQDATFAGGYLVYQGLEGRPSRLLRSWPEGVEDYLLVETRPPRGELRYELELRQVSGLRLVENTLEALDEQGTPRLRVAPPFAVGSDGARVDARLTVEGCEVDTSPAAPWDRALVPPGASLCEVVVRYDESALQYPALIDPSWSSTAAMGTPRALHTAISTSSGVLIAGGLSTSGAVLASAELYNTATNVYAATASMTTKRYRHTADSAAGPVIVAGGFTALSATPTNKSERYNPTSGSWTALGNMATARAAHASSYLSATGVASQVMVCGGLATDGSYLSSAEYFDIASGSWKAASSMLSARAYHTANRVGDRILVVGGLNGASSLSSTTMYSGDLHTFSTWPALSVARHRHTALTLPDGRVWVAGGVQSVSGQPDTVTPSTEIVAYRRSANLIGPRRNQSATLLSNGTVLLAGGFDGAGTALSSAEIFDPTYETLIEAPAFSGARGYHTAVATGTRVIVSGGSPNASLNASSTYLGTSQLYQSTGLLATRVDEYKNDAALDIEVQPTRITERWASVFSPQTLVAGQRYPLLVFLHGEHDTCGRSSNPRIDDDSSYSYTGLCPATYVPVPSHRGYDYVASALAQRGYIVVSVNTNRGINGPANGPDDDPLNYYARARTVLRHLEILSKWDADGTKPKLYPPPPANPAPLPDLKGHIDFSQVGLMGHSRGGQAVRAALAFYRDSGSPWPARIPGLNIRAVFEVGGVDDVFLSRVFNATGVKWAALMGMCDADVTRLDGMRVFDRMLVDRFDNPGQFKAIYSVWGANHRFFNSEWQTTDASGCQGHRALFSYPTAPGLPGSPEQKQAGFLAMVHFFLGSVGANADINQARLFNPAYPTPPEPRVDRGFTPSPSSVITKVLEDFTNVAGKNDNGTPNDYDGCFVTHGKGGPYNPDMLLEHDPTLRGASIAWTTGGNDTYFQSNWAGSGTGTDLSSYAHLELRVDRAIGAQNNTQPETNFVVQLVRADGSRSSAIPIGNYVSLRGPVGGSTFLHSPLQSARIPLSAFGGPLTAIRGVRLTFNSTPSGTIWVANIRAVKTLAGQPN